MPIAVDLSELPPNIRAAIHRDCTNEFGAKARLAQIRQQKIAKFFSDNQPRSIDGVGAQEMAVDPFFVGYFQMRYGINYWEDTDFRNWLRKRHEEFRVISGGTKLQVGYGSKSDVATRKRFTKTFPTKSDSRSHAPNVRSTEAATHVSTTTKRT